MSVITGVRLVVFCLILPGCVTTSNVRDRQDPKKHSQITLFTIENIEAALHEARLSDLNSKLLKSRGISLETYREAIASTFSKMEIASKSQLEKKAACEKKEFDGKTFTKRSVTKFPALNPTEKESIHSYISILNLKLIQECMMPSYAESMYRFAEFQHIVRTLAADLKRSGANDVTSISVISDLDSYEKFLNGFSVERMGGISLVELFYQDSQGLPGLTDAMKEWISSEITLNGPYQPDSIDFSGE